EGRFYLVANDAFTGSTRIEGTNVTVSGTTAGATSEPGEPVPFGTNTIWFSWAAPATGRVQFVGRNIAVYTGSRVDQLQTVRTMGAPNSRYSFLALQDRVYHFQATGGPEVSFPLQFWRYSPATNDLFAAPTLLKGQSVNTMETDWWAFTDAGMEQWEPAHLGTTPARSLWFKWQAPVHGTASFHTEVSLATNVVTSVYEGVALESLRPVAKGTNQVQFPVTGGNWYYLAAAVPTNAVGDFLPYGSVFRSAGSRAVPGNLLQEPSWEGTALNNARSWHWTGGLGGYINAPYGGCDGTTWPALGTGTTLWQDFTAIAGHEYAVRFAYFVGGDLSSCCGDARVRVRWDDRVLGEAVLAGSESGYWHWAEFRALASNTVSRVSFENLARDVEMDAFSVVDLSSPPQIVNEPASISTVAGGTAAFAVGATGSDPLQYQWFFNGAVLAGQTSRYLILESVTTNDSGGYFVTVTNGFGAVTSAPATLYVDAPATPLIVWQPYGDTVPAGGYYSFSVAAAGLPPLTYQWFFHQEALPGATNKTLEFTNVQPAQAGDYQVLVQNPAGGVWSLQALLRVSGADSGGGMIWFGNRYPVGLTNIDAPVLNLDGVTPLDGERYLAQLYAGPSLELLRPAGRPSAFLSGASAGYFRNQTITLANVPAGTAAVVQVRVWEADRGTTYEEARALGGRFGKSELLQVITTEAPTPPAGLTGLKSFSLQAGLPRWTAGVIEFVERQPKGVVVWSLKGAPGFRYLIERAERDQPWQPFVVLTNATGTVTFTDSAESGASTVFFRSRILD
ncbi:MAG TPA: immunoglobulin domain-containing protein, partial [Candidatus Sulfotelmatobacter sp.]|nr:immunoglobulin domain-containing protein [Candidatus Sulfotelmatobacter sp.]